MKRMILLMLAVLLLTGCAVTPAATIPTTVETTQPDPGIYAPGHSLETQSSGAVRVFPLETGCDAIAFMGHKVLTFTQSGDKTWITPYAGENLTQGEAAALSGSYLPGAKTLRIEQQHIGYYDPTKRCIVFLDSGLKETGRTTMPDNMVGTPVLSENMATVFYSTDSEIRAYSLETGISRLVRQQYSQALSVDAALFEDSMLMCGITNSDGRQYVEFISTQTGEPLGEDNALVSLDHWQNQYYLQRQDSLTTEYIFSGADGSQQCFHPQSGVSQLHSLLPMGAVLTVSYGETAVTLDLFDLFDGNRKASLILEGVTQVKSVIADPDNDLVWFLCTQNDKPLLCSWDPKGSSVEDTNSYTKPRYTLNNPDTDALAACRQKADDLAARFGVEISFLKEPLASSDYSLIYEHQPAVLMDALEQLDQAMSIFPEGFFQTAAEISDSHKLHIGLVRGLKRKTTGVPDGIAASQYWVDGNAWMALTVGDTVKELFIHQLAHYLDTFVYSKNVAYDEWSKLNPEDFSYDLSYLGYEDNADSKYLSGKNRAFVDAYSMTYPKEDRARIFDCALAEGNEELFASKTMQSKLRQLCVGIRNAYGWKKDSRSFPWEQYLETPLAYSKK